MRRLPLLAAVAVTLVPVASGDGASPGPPVQAVAVSTGQGPCGTSVRAGSLWVGVYGAGDVLQIDPRGRIETKIGVGRWACRVAVGPAAVWVTATEPASWSVSHAGRVAGCT